MGRKNSIAESFIEKAKVVHNDKYDYSLVEYHCSIEKVKIICPIHGKFLQRPAGHLQGAGCKKCGMESIAKKNIHTLAKFIEKAKEVHNNKYDYSFVDYKGHAKKVKIICPIHGKFLQLVNNHLQGQGCKKCSIDLRKKICTLPVEEFIKRGEKIHNNKYDYSLVEYKIHDEKVKIICPQHGEFLQTPTGHLQGAGCKKCGIESRAKKSTYTLAKFIEKAKEVHGNSYDYSLVEYKKSTKPVIIICQFHGKFGQLPSYHLQGYGCPYCKYPKIACERKMIIPTTKGFIEKAKEVHGDKYDYSLVDYQGSAEKVKIICPQHGEFSQLANNHLHGYGCTKCGIESRIKNRKCKN